MFQVAGLDDAAASECHIGRFSSGIDHARQAYQQTKQESGTVPGLVGGTAFALAECLLSRHENLSVKADAAALNEVKELLGSINVDAVAHFSGDPSFQGSMDVAEARLGIAKKQFEMARQMANKARPFFDGTHGDASEKEALDRVEDALAHSNSTLR
jgi:hypothetical protein